MRIQVITGNANVKNEGRITVSDYSRPSAMDDFDINVVDLSYDGIWNTNRINAGSINYENDLISIEQMVSGSQKTSVIYVFPKDGVYKYRMISGQCQKRIKDIVTDESYKQEYLECIPQWCTIPKIVFEPTTTIVGDNRIEADFHFDYSPG